MNICSVNPNSFKAKIQFENKQPKPVRLLKKSQDFCLNSEVKAAAWLKKSLFVLTCFSAIITKLIKVRQSIKLPS